MKLIFTARCTWTDLLIKSFLSLLFSCIFTFNSFADLILTAPPRETPEAGKKIYEPLAQYFSHLLGETVIYEHPLNWSRYEKKMKNDEYDIIFDGPHFAAWRIDSLLATPLIKLPGNLRFVLVTSQENTAIRKPEHLIGKTICTLPAPNLGALTLFSMYPHPARQPDYLLIQGGFKEIVKALQAGECDAGIIRSSFYENKTSEEFRAATKVIRQSEALTNQGITVSRRIKQNQLNKLIHSLTSDEGQSALQPLLDRFYSDAKQFIPSTAQDYKDHNLLRDTVIYGW